MPSGQLESGRCGHDDKTKLTYIMWRISSVSISHFIMAFLKTYIVICICFGYSLSDPSQQYAAAPSNGYGGGGGGGGGSGEMPYAFEWAVKDDYSGNDYSHKQSNDGKVTSGQYRVLLPDSRVQTVNFKSDGYSGFLADVKYDGKAVFPKPNKGYGGGYSAPQPSYSPPTPSYRPPAPSYPPPPAPAPAPSYPPPPAPAPSYPAPPAPAPSYPPPPAPAPSYPPPPAPAPAPSYGPPQYG